MYSLNITQINHLVILRMASRATAGTPILAPIKTCRDHLCLPTTATAASTKPWRGQKYCPQQELVVQKHPRKRQAEPVIIKRKPPLQET